VLPAYRRAGHPVRAVLSDNGGEWGGAFRTQCQALGIAVRRTQPAHPWTNGFVERLQGTILTEHWRVVFRRTYFTRLDQLERSLQRYLRCYNDDRTHRGYRLQLPRYRQPALIVNLQLTIATPGHPNHPPDIHGLRGLNRPGYSGDSVT
jgi:transposase InsO family protein